MSELLLTKLNIKSCGFNAVASGGIPTLTQYDIAAALSYGCLSRPAYYLARTKYCEDVQAEQKLSCLVRNFVARLIQINHWELGSGGLNGLVSLVMLEGVYGVSCKKCKGIGSVTPVKKALNKIEPCKKCEGSGRGELSQRLRAAKAGLPLSTWHRHWNDRLKLLISEINVWESELIGHVKRQCYDE